MNIGKITNSSFFTDQNMPHHQSTLVKLANRLQLHTIEKNLDKLILSSDFTTLKSKKEESGIYERSAVYSDSGFDWDYLRTLKDYVYGTKEIAFDALDWRKYYTNNNFIGKFEIDQRVMIQPPSEKSNYSEYDALMNQYMKQYRADIKIEMTGDSLTLSGDKTLRLILPGMISDDELENFRAELVQNGLGQEIDWRGVENDFVAMGISKENTAWLDKKADYLTSRYAILKKRIQEQYSGSGLKEQLDILNQLYENTKKKIADSYADEIGGFYENLGQKGVAENFRVSMLSIIDEKAEIYEKYLSENTEYSKISNPENEWLLQDDAYMAAQLRESYSMSCHDNCKEGSIDHYSMEDLMFAGLCVKSLSSPLENISSRLWNYMQSLDSNSDDSRLGKTFAKLSQEMQELTNHASIGKEMKNLATDIFRPFMDKVMDKLDEMLDNRKSQAIQDPVLFKMYRITHIDRALVYQSYNSVFHHL